MPTPTVSDSDLLDARILLVDDQPANLQLLEQMLSGTGYRNLRCCSRPKEVLGLHQEHDFDLIVLDLQMPGMDGFEVMEQLQTVERDPYLPVLVLTAQPSQKLRALQAGARDFVGKPFELVELQARIRNLIEVRLLHRRLAGHNEALEQAVQERTAELRESEARFKRLVELATDWYWEQDESGRFTRVSGPALEMLGLADAEGGTAGGGWVADERQALDEKLAARRPFLDFVYRRMRADGSEQVLQASGEPSFDEAGRFRGYRGLGTDVTGRGAGASTATLQRFRDALEDAGLAIILRDAASLRIVDATAAACRLSGYDRPALLGLEPGALDPGGEAALRAGFDRLPDGEHDIGELRGRGGSPIPVERQRFVHRDRGGTLLVELLRPLEAAR